MFGLIFTSVKGRRVTHLYGFKPAGLLHLVVDDGLVLNDAIISGSGEDHILESDKEETES